MRFYPSVFTGNDPRKGWRIPLNRIKYNEQRDEETYYGYFGDNPNCLIIAPTNSLGVSNNIERVINKGCWRFFYNGEMIYSHSGGWLSTFIMERKLELLRTDGVLKLVNENKLEILFKIK